MYIPGKSHIERMVMCVPPDSDYQNVCSASAEVLGLQIVEKQELRLFRTDGTMIADRNVTGSRGQWTIEQYLKVANRSSAQMKLGVGIYENNMVCNSLGADR